MQGRRSATATLRRNTSWCAETMSGGQRRQELIEIMAAGIERAIAERTFPPSGDAGFSADSPVYAW
ncbi:MAG: hypothetical protein D8M59_07540 [Planctomycetes bacterium]|nr:hypothetical protein [Planctomycetota bacterium]NOG53180.1 hypothetical protein [Planctomycetota bacterium]